MNYSPEVQALNAGLIHTLCEFAPSVAREGHGDAPAMLPVPRLADGYWWSCDKFRVVRVESVACLNLGLAGPLVEWSARPVWAVVRSVVESIDWRGLGWRPLGPVAWRPYRERGEFGDVVSAFPVRFGDCWFNSFLVRPFSLLPGCEWQIAAEQRLALRWPGGVGLVMCWEFGEKMEYMARRAGLSGAEFPYSSGGAE